MVGVAHSSPIRAIHPPLARSPIRNLPGPLFAVLSHPGNLLNILLKLQFETLESSLICSLALLPTSHQSLNVASATSAIVVYPFSRCSFHTDNPDGFLLTPDMIPLPWILPCQSVQTEIYFLCKLPNCFADLLEASSTFPLPSKKPKCVNKAIKILQCHST